MKIALSVVGGMLVLVGVVWFFQGINLLPGSFMTGQVEWAWYGGMSFIAGLGLLFWAGRRS